MLESVSQHDDISMGDISSKLNTQLKPFQFIAYTPVLPIDPRQ